MHRPTVGIIALILLTAAVVLTFWDVEQGDVWQAACVRIGLLMGALWLAHPHFEGLHPWLLGVIVLVGAAVLIVAAKRPLQVALLAVIGIILAYLRGKAKQK